MKKPTHSVYCGYSFEKNLKIKFPKKNRFPNWPKIGQLGSRTHIPQYAQTNQKSAIHIFKKLRGKRIDQLKSTKISKFKVFPKKRKKIYILWILCSSISKKFASFFSNKITYKNSIPTFIWTLQLLNFVNIWRIWNKLKKSLPNLV